MAVSPKQWSVKLLAYLLVAGIQLIGRRRASILARRMLTGPWIWRVSRFILNKKNHYLDANLALVLPALSVEQRDEIRHAYYNNILITAIESMTMDGKDHNRTDFEGLEHLQQARATGFGIMFVSGHFNNWEINYTNIEQLGFPLQVLYKDFSADGGFNHYRYNRHFRSAKTMIPTGSIRRFIAGLEAGANAYVMVDLKVKNDRIGCRLNFAEHPAWTSVFAAEMALRHRMLLIPTYTVRMGKGRFFQHFEAPLYIPDHSIETVAEPQAEIRQQAIELTKKINQSLSKPLVNDPASWLLWDTNRWGP